MFLTFFSGLENPFRSGQVFGEGEGVEGGILAGDVQHVFILTGADLCKKPGFRLKESIHPGQSPPVEIEAVGPPIQGQPRLVIPDFGFQRRDLKTGNIGGLSQ